MRGFSITLTAVNGLYIASGLLVWAFVIASSDPYAGLLFLPWLAAWPVLAVAAIVWFVMVVRRREHVRETVPDGLRRATAVLAIVATAPFGVLLLYFLIVAMLPEWQMDDGPISIRTATAQSASTRS